MAGRRWETDAEPGRRVRFGEAILGLFGRGKPRYVATMAEAGRHEKEEAYLTLSWLLLEVLASGRSPGEVGRQAGGRFGEAAIDTDTGQPADALVKLEDFLESRGFMPRQIGIQPEVGFVLDRCPYEQAALVNPSLVCGLHRALAEGILEALGGDFEVTRLVARHPTTAGCRLELRALGQAD